MQIFTLNTGRYQNNPYKYIYTITADLSIKDLIDHLFYAMV